MQKVIIIDQEFCVQHKLNIEQYAIYYYLKTFAENIKSDTVTVTASLILNQMPALRFRTRQYLYKQLKILQNKKLISIEKKPGNIYQITIKELVRHNNVSKYDMYDPSRIARESIVR